METPMSIIKHYQYRGKLSELSCRFDAFKRLDRPHSSTGWHPWKDQKTRNTTYDKMVFFVGKTGFGKSSTINAITGLTHMKTSEVEACTRQCQTLEYRVDDSHCLSMADLPGVGESQLRDEEYRKMYSNFLQYASAVVYLVRVDSRDFAIDLAVLEQLCEEIPGLEQRLIIAVGQCDKAEPISRRAGSEPTMEQFRTIQAKVTEVDRILLPYWPVVAYSAATGWNLEVLVDLMVEVLNVS
jgi:predicted GTPase